MKRPLSRPLSSDSVVASMRIGYRLFVELHVWVLTMTQHREDRKRRTAKLNNTILQERNESSSTVAWHKNCNLRKEGSI